MPTIGRRSTRSRSPANTPAASCSRIRRRRIWVIGICDGSGGILSKKAIEELGDKIATTLIGSGPYLLKEWKPNEHLTLEVNPDYKGTRQAPFPAHRR